ncbi:hypothetical protein GCM10010406_35480 [Streptomyces thermolineatus]|uniref:Condensation domain-containing protein n=1 Tax=Streptomyces thermolineatus TaxID=44033 RepID=A0ABN3M5D9_9ACTN
MSRTASATAPSAPLARTVPVRFRAPGPVPADAGADGAVEAPLTWSQQYYLAEVDAARVHGRGLNVPRLYRLRAGTTEADVAAALRGLVERYEVLRSRIVRDGPGGVRQRVHARGTLHLAVHEVPAAAGDHARAVLDALAAPPLDVTECWPLRAALVTEGRHARHLALAFSHVAVDAYALVPVSAYLVERIAEADPVARAAPAPGGPSRGPREQAAAEASPAGERAAQRALRLAEEAYRRMPAAPRPAAAPPAAPRYRFLRRRSPALDLAVGAVAARTKESPATVLAAALAALDATRAGPVPGDGTPATRYGTVQLISANRLRPETAAAVLPLSQPVPCCVDTAGATFHELVRRTAAASLRAFRAGGCPPDRLAALLRAVEEERGVRLDSAPTLNHRPRSTALPVRPTTAAELADAAAGAVTEETDADPWRAGHYLSADVDAAGIRLLLQIDTAVHPPEWAERWTDALERLLCAAALDAECPALPEPPCPAPPDANPPGPDLPAG